MARLALSLLVAVVVVVTFVAEARAASSRLLTRVPVRSPAPQPEPAADSWGPHRVPAPRELAGQDVSPRYGRLARIARLLQTQSPSEGVPTCQPGRTWRTECGKCYCNAKGLPECAGDDCSYLSDQEGDGSILDLDMGDDMDLQALSSERHVIVLLP